MQPSRRAFLVTGVLGVAALAAGGLLREWPLRSGPATALRDATILHALVPAMLDDALPADARERDLAITETVTGVQAAVAGLPPNAQGEIARLFGLLAFAPFRVGVAGLWRDWPQASLSDTAGMLARWQHSRLSLLRSAYDGLHQLILAAWYGNPRAWEAIGYAGPPALAGAPGSGA